MRDRLPQMPRHNRAAILTLGTVGAAVWLSASRGELQAATDTPPLTEASKAPRVSWRLDPLITEVLARHPKLRAYFATMSYDESFRVGGDLAQRGMCSLADEQLLRVVALQLRQTEQLGDRACEMLLAGDGLVAVAAMELLPDTELREFITYKTLAQLLALEVAEISLTPQEAAAERERRLAEVRGSLSAEARAAFETQACFSEETMFRSALALAPAEGGRMIRAFLEPSCRALPPPAAAKR